MEKANVPQKDLIMCVILNQMKRAPGVNVEEIERAQRALMTQRITRDMRREIERFLQTSFIMAEAHYYPS